MKEEVSGRVKTIRFEFRFKLALLALFALLKFITPKFLLIYSKYVRTR